MKVCPKCSVRYSETWNICAACKCPLKKEGVLGKIFGRHNSFAKPPSLTESMVDQANAIFLYLDKNLKPVICSQAIEYITGYSREEIFNGDWLNLFFRNYPSRKEMFKAFIESTLASMRSRAYECVVTRKDGGECILSWRNAVMTDASGDISGIICTAYDITEKISSEDTFAVQTESLRNIFASIKDYALITTNLEDKITYYEKGSAELFEWESDMTLKDISIIFPEEDRYKIIGKIEEAVKKNGKFEEEVKLMRQRQGVFPAVLTITILHNSKGERTGCVYVARDITKGKRLEEELVQAAKLAAIGQLGAGVAHEMSNPLLVISGRLEMLSMEDEKLSPEVKRTIDIIKNQTQRMKIIVDRLLSFSRKKAPRMDTVDVNEVLKTISPLLAYHPEFKNIIWKEKLTENLPKIQGDFNQLQEMFLNIGLNACQAMPKGGLITISSKDKKDGFIEVTIKDTGIGVKKEDLDKLFTPFFTSRDSGTGLGLAICQSIVHSHGGKVRAESELGKGSIFRITLPVKKE